MAPLRVGSSDFLGAVKVCCRLALGALLYYTFRLHYELNTVYQIVAFSCKLACCAISNGSMDENRVLEPRAWVQHGASDRFGKEGSA